MKLWVRSQDKKILTKVNYLEVYGSSTDWWIMGNDNDLGTYKSKERALEVLDEIQNTIIGFENENNYVSTQCYSIYEMPEE